MGREIDVRLGKRMRALRKAADLSIAGLAEASKIDESFLTNVELGKTSLTVRTAAKLADGLNIDLSKLLADTVPKPLAADAKIQGLVRALVRGKTRKERADLVSVMKALRNKKKLAAVKELLRA